jgi:putative membrane protein
VKVAAFVGAVAGLVLLLVLTLHTDLPAMVQALVSGGWELLLLVPYRALFFLLYALGWLVLLRPGDPGRRAGLGYLFWVTSVREAIDRLLPVASVGGSIAGIRLVRWRGLRAAPLSASVIVEIVLTLVVSYVFAAAGLAVLVGVGGAHQDARHVVIALLLSLPVPVAAILLLRYGSVFARLQKTIGALAGLKISFDIAPQIDHEVRLSLHRRWRVAGSAGLQLLALASGSFEIWFAMRLFQHPVDWKDAFILESMTIGLRHLAFIVPAGIGVQEAGLVLFGHALGIDSELALAVSMVKRAREVIWGIPSLISWQWMEGRRLRGVCSA